MAPASSYYVRVGIDDISDSDIADNSWPADADDARCALTCVDLRTRNRQPPASPIAQTATLTNAVQGHLHLLSKTDGE